LESVESEAAKVQSGKSRMPDPFKNPRMLTLDQKEEFKAENRYEDA